jgi:hypothetical protein
MTVIERTHSRDLFMSKRHRLWGGNCPGADLDFLLVEYDQGIPMALVEYKKEFETWLKDDVNIRAVANLGDMADIPALVAVYMHRDECWCDIDHYSGYGTTNERHVQFDVVPLNTKAAHLVQASSMSERAFVDLLYRLRNGRETPTSVLRRLHDKWAV